MCRSIDMTYIDIYTTFILAFPHALQCVKLLGYF